MLNGEKLEGIFTVTDSVTEPTPIRLTGGGRVVSCGR